MIRLANGALNLGYAVAIVDLKGGGSLGPAAQGLAQSRGISFNSVDPKDPESFGYDPCTGGPSHIANKLIGAFSFGPNAEIYKNVAMEVVPVISRAIQHAGADVTLPAIYSALGKGGLLNLARSAQGVDRDRLMQLDQTSGSVGTAGYSGLQRRIGALMEGEFRSPVRASTSN